MGMRGTAAVILLLLACLGVASADAAGERILVVYDGGAAEGSREAEALGMVLDLLGHFDSRTTAVSADDYRAGQLTNYDATIYLGLREGQELSESLLADCYDSERAVCWVGSNLGQLAGHFSLGRYGFRLRGGESRPRSVVYRGRHYRRATTVLPQVVVTRPDVCQVLAVAQGDGEETPYAIRSGSFWYFAELPGARGDQTASRLILSDQLHHMLEAQHSEARQALICIAGVSAETDAGSLGTLIGYLERGGVPFAISVVPVLGGQEAGREMPLSGSRGLLGVLRGAQKEGASIIAHGLDDGGPASEGAAGSPAEGLRDLRRQFERAIGELARCGLYPVAWVREEGRARTEEEEVEIGAFCSTVWRRREWGEEGGDLLPLLLRAKLGGYRVIPDNLTQLREGRGEVEAMLAEARDHAEVSDAWVTASISPSAPLSAVELVVRGLRQLGYEFADLRAMTNWTQSASLHVHTVAEAHAVGELIPEGWGGTLIAGEGGKESRFERPGRNRRGEVKMRPGALLLAYPAGQRPRPIFALEGGLEGVTHRFLYGIAQIVILAGVAACGVLVIIYVSQVIWRRRA